MSHFAVERAPFNIHSTQNQTISFDEFDWERETSGLSDDESDTDDLEFFGHNGVDADVLEAIWAKQDKKIELSTDEKQTLATVEITLITVDPNTSSSPSFFSDLISRVSTFIQDFFSTLTDYINFETSRVTKEKTTHPKQGQESFLTASNNRISADWVKS